MAIASNRAILVVAALGLWGCTKKHSVIADVDTGVPSVDTGTVPSDAGAIVDSGVDTGSVALDAGCGLGAVGAECTDSAECCSGACSGHVAGAYYYATIGECLAPAPDGSYCLQDSWCANHNCVGNLCGGDGTSCIADWTKNCRADTDCCSGLCNPMSSPSGCEPKRSPGDSCNADGWCLSGSCADSTCQ